MKDGITEEYLHTLLQIIPKLRVSWARKNITKKGNSLTKKEIEILGLTKKSVIAKKTYTFTQMVPVYRDHLVFLRNIAKNDGMKGLEEYVALIKSRVVNIKMK